jgi:hypothetical protein
LAILLLILFAPGFVIDAGAESTDAGLPTGVAYPIHVRLSVRVLDVTRLTETQSSIGATVEFTQRWTDPGLRFDRIALGAEHLDFVGAKAEAELARMWSPDVLIDNMISQPRAQSIALSIFWDGQIVLIRRQDADFREILKMSSFPFDEQRLEFTFISRRYAADEVLLSTTELDRNASSVERSISIVNWRPSRIAFVTDSFYGWNARPFAKVTAVATVERVWWNYFERLFVPFGAVMSLSLFLLWSSEEVIEINKRAAIVFSSLLALAALSFTFESSFPGAISMNSPIAFMISIGYFYLPFVLTIDVYLSQKKTHLTRKYPYLLSAIRGNVRWTVPFLFTALCILSLFPVATAGAR